MEVCSTVSIVMARVGASIENSKGHDRDDHAAAQIGEVRTFHTDKANGVFRLWARHWIVVSSDHWNIVAQKISFNPAYDAGINVIDVCVQMSSLTPKSLFNAAKIILSVLVRQTITREPYIKPVQ